ncbi:MAG: hypothetical protein IKJ16_03775 [Agathobacter sp.]|nr:hypothetical protein [Agathobacter sp.]
MDVNKMLFRGVRVGVILVVALLIVYATMHISFTAYDYAYRYAIQTLMGESTDEIASEAAKNTEGTGK